MDNYNYPAGADTKDAPWNREGQPDLKFDVAVSCSLSREAPVWSDNYTQDPDDPEDSPSLEDPTAEYEESYASLTDIIDFAKKAAAHMINEKDYYVASVNELYRILDSCQDWYLDEFNVEQI